MSTVERIFYCVLALADPSELLPLARALRAVELHIRRECEREILHLRRVAEKLKQRVIS